MNIGLVRRLWEAGGFVPLHELGGDELLLERELGELAAFGYPIERHPYRGVACRGPSERLCPDQIEQGLSTELIGHRIEVWERVASTNDVAARAAASGSNEGLVVLAEEQTAGRGRRGRVWSAPAKRSLLMSVVLFPPLELQAVGWITALGAVALAHLIEREAGLQAGIKWPNDVRVSGRKIAGVLVERRGAAGYVLGIGLNLNLAPEEFPEELRGSATSIQIETGRSHDRSEWARELIREVDRLYGQAREGELGPLGRGWCARLERLGRQVRLVTRGGMVEGMLTGADLRQGLTVESANGQRVIVPSVDVLSFDEDLG